MKDRFGNKLSGTQTLEKGKNRIKTILLEFELMFLRWVGYIPSHMIRRFFYRLSGIKIGKGSTIHMGAQFYNPSGISIGDDTIIGDHAVLDGRAKLLIGSHVATGSGVHIYNAQHDIDHEHFIPVFADSIISDYAYIGPRSVLLPGVIIHEGGVVAAGAIVTKDVPPFTLVAGVPAKEIRKRRLTSYMYRLGRASWFR
jgi:maltose O-acetyltransferase